MNISFMSFSCQEASFEELLRIAKQLGYDGIEPRLGCKHGHGIEFDSDKTFRERCRLLSEKAGIFLCCLATSCQYADEKTCGAMVEDTHKAIDLAGDVGAPVIRVFGGWIPKGVDRETAIQQVVGALGKVADHAGERGVAVCVETHDHWCDPQHVAEVLRRVNHPAVAANWDLMHPVRVSDVSIDDSYKAIKPWIKHVHFHDGDKTDDRNLKFRPVGEGIVDHERAVQLLEQNGYEGFISGEWIGWDPWETHLPRELATMRGYAQVGT